MAGLTLARSWRVRLVHLVTASTYCKLGGSDLKGAFGRALGGGESTADAPFLFRWVLAEPGEVHFFVSAAHPPLRAAGVHAQAAAVGMLGAAGLPGEGPEATTLVS